MVEIISADLAPLNWRQKLAPERVNRAMCPPIKPTIGCAAGIFPTHAARDFSIKECENFSLLFRHDHLPQFAPSLLDHLDAANLALERASMSSPADEPDWRTASTPATRR